MEKPIYRMPPEKARTGLRELAARAQAEAEEALVLSRLFQGRQKLLLRQMYSEGICQSRCIKGVEYLIRGQIPPIRAAPQLPQGTAAALRRAYGMSLNALREYEIRCGDREYGPVFQELAAQKRRHCGYYAEILGNFRE